MLGRLLFFALIILGVYLFVRSSKRRARRKEEDRRAAMPETRDMVRCQVCQVHLPRDEAILSHGRFYCCEDHLRQDQGRAGS